MRWRDGLWIAGQVVVLVVSFVVVPLVDGGIGRLDLPGQRVVGLALLVVAVSVGIVAMRQLGAQLVPQPTPIHGGEVVDHGLYGVVRHPIYLAVLLACAGSLTLVASLTGLVVLAAAVLFFDRKAAWEESLLVAAYPGYVDYQRRVRFRLLPGLR